MWRRFVAVSGLRLHNRSTRQQVNISHSIGVITSLFNVGCRDNLPTFPDTVTHTMAHTWNFLEHNIKPVSVTHHISQVNLWRRQHGSIIFGACYSLRLRMTILDLSDPGCILERLLGKQTKKQWSIPSFSLFLFLPCNAKTH